MPASASSTTEAPPTRLDPRPALVTRAFDGLTDVAVLGFASWTLVYQAAYLLAWPTDLALIAWFVTLPPVAWVTVRRHAASRDTAPEVAEPADAAPTPPRGDLLWVAAGVGLAVASAVLMFRGSSLPWHVGWLAALASITVGIVRLYRTERTLADVRPTSGAGWLPSTLVAVVALGWSVLSVFTLRVDPDDAFYVNKSVFVAERGFIPLRDTIFGDQTLPPLPGAGTAPLQSTEVLFGALAHLFGLEAGTVVYLIAPPLATFVATWAIWRLLREWAPVRALACFVVSMAYLTMSGESGAGVGVFFIGRLPQGKVIFLAALLPLIYLYVTRWARTHDRWYLVMLTAAGVTAVGLTSSATFVVPIVAVACAAALLVTRRRWVGVLALAAYPVVTGGIVALTGTPGDPGGYFYAGAEAFRFVLGSSLVTVVAWLGVLLAAWLTFPGTTRVIVAAATLALGIVLAPDFASVFSSATGAGAVAWRLMWVAPITVMVGLLGAVRLPRTSPRLSSAPFTVAAAAAPTVVVVTALVLAGTPFFSPLRSVEFTSTPTWKYPESYLRQAFAIERLDPGPGPVLAPLSTMRALSLVSSSVHAVAARPSYIRILSEPRAQHDARILLTEVMGGIVRPNPDRSPDPEDVRAAVRTLDVSMVCARPSQKEIRDAIGPLSWRPVEVRGLDCYVNPAASVRG